MRMVHKNKVKTLQERFEAKFAKSDGCWEWGAGKVLDGYGHFSIAGMAQKAHRVAYQLYVGEIPEGMCVCHHCDNPGCVNPSHLFLGTNADNIRDRENKVRGVRPMNAGEKHGHSKLTEAQVIEIRAKHSSGARVVDLAKEFGVVHQTISKIVHRRAWTRI